MPSEWWWGYFRKCFLGAAVAGLILFSSLSGPYSLLRIYHFRKQRNQIKKDIFQLVEENNLLRQEIQNLRSDPEYISRIAREELGLVKPGEIIYRYYNDTKRKKPDKLER